MASMNVTQLIVFLKDLNHSFKSIAEYLDMDYDRVMNIYNTYKKRTE